MPTPKNYDPGRLALVVNGVTIQGFGTGTVIKVSRMTATFSSKVGADGHVVRTKSRDKRVKLEITLMQSSPSNDYLSGLCVTDENVDAGVGACGPALLKELNGTTLCTGPYCWVTQPADAEYGVDSSERSWVVEVADAKMFVGGLTV